MSLIQSSGLTKSFGQFKAVDDVSFAVDRGEVAGFLGPNGAGKSTTMKMLCGYLQPDRGTASISGFDIQSHPVTAKQHLGYLPEGAPAYSDMSVAAYLQFSGRMRGMSGARLRSRLGEVAHRINLTEVWNKQIDALSKGYKRRVGIAQALLHDPEVLVLDEPTDGLDPNQKHEMRELIREIAANKAIIISTHILEEVEAVCSRAIIISEGRVVADSTPDDLIRQHAPANAHELVMDGRAPDAVTTSLQVIAGVETVEILDRSDSTTRLILRMNDAGEIPAGVFDTVRNAQMHVRGFGEYRPTLEQLFRQITQADTTTTRGA
ncbi:MAG: ATP-binding cassette domain-containing protein [Burkholderiaceae bacterium]